jgi:lipopolysaccharide exporter
MSIAQKAARGVAWNMVLGIGSRILQLVGTLVLTRFIAPEAYGAVLAASIAVVTAGSFSSFAFGQYLIARRSGPEVCFQAAVVHVALGIVTVALLLVFSAPLGDWLDTPGLVAFVPAFALAHLLERVRYIPERILIRDLRFRTLATVNASAEVLFTVVALALAPRYGAAAIAIATIVRAAFSMVTFLAVAPREQWLRPAALQPAVVREMFAYGFPVLIAALADRAATRWDSLVMSKLFGPAVMARYNLSYSLAETPINSVAEHIGEVLMPAFSAMGEAERRNAVVKSAAQMALVVSPLGVGLGAIAPNLVAAFFDARWAPMAPMLVILSVMTVFRPMTWPAIAYLQAISRTRLIMVLAIARAVLVLALVTAGGLLGGPLWATGGACLAYAIYSIGTIGVSAAATGIAAGPYLAGVTRPLLACLPMFGATLEAGRLLAASDVPLPVTLGAQVLVGGVTYAAGAWLFARPALLDFLRLARAALQRRRVTAPSG